MSEEFRDGDVVWVKCGSLFWPARVLDFKNLPKEVQEDFPDESSKPNIIAKFFDEDGYEYLFENKNIFAYNCSRKEEFIKKGLAKSKSKSKEGATSGWFAKFPKDVIESEKLTGGDEAILEKEPYAEKTNEKINYKALFGGTNAAQEKDKKKVETPKSVAQKRKAEASPGKKTPQAGAKKKRESEKVSTPARPIVHPRFMEGGSGSDHQVTILPQPSAPYHIDLQMKQEKLTASAPNTYTCPICGFVATRINVIVLHSKSHSEPAKNSSVGLTRPVTMTTHSKPATPSTPAATPKGRKKTTATPAPVPKKSESTPAKRGSGSNVATPKAPTEEEKSTPRSRGKKAPPAADPAPTSEVTPKRGRGRPPAGASKTTVAPAASPPPSPTVSPSKSPLKSPQPDSKTKRTRLTKKKKELIMQEKEKKEEERQKILGEWSEEEEGEAEERRRINETLGKSSDNSDDDSDREAFLGDDHVHGYDDEDEEEPMDTDEPTKEVDPKPDEQKEETTEKINGETSAAVIEQIPETKKTEEPEPVQPEQVEKPVEPEIEPTPEKDEAALDIDKVLAETAVPTLSSDIENVVKKSVKFSPALSKEIALKTIRVMQPESNYLDPQDVDDEFAFTEEPRIPELMATKTILKRSRTKGDSPFRALDTGAKPGTVKLTFNAPAEELSEEDKEQDAIEEAKQVPDVAIVESTETNPSTETVVEEEKPQQQEELQTQVVLETSEGQQIQVHNGSVADDVAATGGGDHDGETYILLVDDDENAGAHLESLNSQTLYIDSSSLANGDLSNMVLMTDGSQGSNQMVFSTSQTNQLVASAGGVLSLDGVEAAQPPTE